MSNDRLFEKIIALLRTVAVKGLLMSHFLYSATHGFDYSLTERQCDIADPQPDHLAPGILGSVFLYLPCNRRKKIAVL